ncbi:hypothetical protein JF66_19100 [Cryobacterium sp. MLB-32]|nr:hypothetical protein JF66_19100 [Cryobacterium sp. MLB-32]
MDPSGAIVFVNHRVESLFGYDRGDLVGQPIRILVPDYVREERTAEPRRRSGDRVVGARHRDGSELPVTISVSEVDTGHILLMMTAEREVNARAQALENARLLAAIVENANDAVIATTLDGIVTTWNAAAQSSYGYSREEMVGTSIDRLSSESRMDEIPSMLAKIKAGVNIDRFETVRIRKDGTLVQVVLTVSPIRDDDGIAVGASTIARDVTAARQAFEAARSMIESSLDSLVAISPEGLITDVNEATVKATGIPRVELIGTAFSDCFTEPEKAEAIYQLVFEKGMAVDYPLTMRHRDGTLTEVLYNASVYRDVGGNVLGVFAAARDVTEVRRAQEAVAYQAFHDPLTGLHNRAWILDILAADLRAAQRWDHPLGVLFVDIDRLKTVNDSLGHAAGDELLTTVAHRMVAALRAGDRIGRFGGDEFVIVLQDMQDVQDALSCAERVSSSISADMHVRGHRIVPSVSIGIATSTSTSTSGSLLRDADVALFQAKAAGRARWHFFDDAMHGQALARLTLEDELREAIAHHQFVVYYQPIVALADARVVGHEALVRWAHPSRGLLSPAEFLDIAEDTGLISAIGAQVLDQVCALLAERPDLPGPVSVNVSAVQLSEPTWLASVRETLTAHHVSPARVVIEVTETAVLSLVGSAQVALAELRGLGVGIHLDDFGTGYSSISVLRELPVTGVKLDLRFVQDLTEGDSRANALAQGVSGLVKGLHLTGIAEGIETQVQADILRAQGWECGQGYLFGRPGPSPACRVPA